MDEVFVERLRLFAPVGVSEAEREVGCWVEIDACATLDARPEGDSVESSVDYVALAETCQQAAAVPTQTLEALCARVADAVLAMPGVEEVEVEARKPSPPAPIHGAVGVRTVRRRPGQPAP